VRLHRTDLSSEEADEDRFGGRIPLLRGCGFTALISPRRGGREGILSQKRVRLDRTDLSSEREGNGIEARKNKRRTQICGFGSLYFESNARYLINLCLKLRDLGTERVGLSASRPALYTILVEC